MSILATLAALLLLLLFAVFVAAITVGMMRLARLLLRGPAERRTPRKAPGRSASWADDDEIAARSHH